jgi:hypothetical protein
MQDIELSTLRKQVEKYEAALAEFLLVESELRRRGSSARVADMLRINRETINSMERSVELVKMRLAAAEMPRGSGTPFAASATVQETVG